MRDDKESPKQDADAMGTAFDKHLFIALKPLHDILREIAEDNKKHTKEVL